MSGTRHGSLGLAGAIHYGSEICLAVCLRVDGTGCWSLQAASFPPIPRFMANSELFRQEFTRGLKRLIPSI